MSEDPPRLFQDPAVPDDVRALLRDLPGPPPMPEAAFTSGRRRVAVMAAFPVFMAGLFKAKTAVAAAVALAMTAVAVTSAVVVHERYLASNRAMSPLVQNVQNAGDVAAPIALPAPTPEATFTAATASEHLEPPAAGPKGLTARAVDLRPALTASSAPLASEDQLAEEVKVLQEAKALVKSQPQAALAKTREHASRFPRGTLSLEREMVAVEALVASGRMQDARSRANALRSSVKGTIYETRLDMLVGMSAP